MGVSCVSPRSEKSCIHPSQPFLNVPKMNYYTCDKHDLQVNNIAGKMYT